LRKTRFRIIRFIGPMFILIVFRSRMNANGLKFGISCEDLWSEAIEPKTLYSRVKSQQAGEFMFIHEHQSACNNYENMCSLIFENWPKFPLLKLPIQLEVNGQ
jgi:hypothetical protein